MPFLYPLLTQLPGSGDFSPHGFCYLWNRQLMWLHVISDVGIALAYFTIPFTLLWFIRKRRDIPFSWIFGLFALFIVACGLTHLMEIWNIWHTAYWLEGGLKAVTALASVLTAFVLARSVPTLVALPSGEQWRVANEALEAETRERRETELRLREQEAHFRDLAELVELTHDAIFVRSLDWNILFWNPAAERLYGWTKEEAIGAISYELLKTVFPIPREEIEAIVLNQGSWEGELTQTRRTGEVLVVSSRWALRRDADGNPVSILASNRDITSRSKEEIKFRGLLESAPDPVVIVDGQGVIRLVNARAQNVFGYSREELVGQRVEIIVPERFRENHVGQRQQYARCPVQRAMGESRELFGRRKDGSEFPVEISLSPLETSEGTLISSAIRDVSERIRIQQQHEAQYREIAELMELTHDAIFVRDLSSKVLYWNAAAERLYGWTKAEAIGTVTHQLLRTVFPIPLDEIEADLLRCGFWEGELRHTSKNGEVRIVSSRWALRRDANGEPVSMLESNRDVTARANEDQKFRGVLESAPDPMVIVDRNGVIRLVNARTQAVFGYSRDELLGQAVEIIVPERFREGHVGRRTRYSSCPVSRAMGASLELYGRRKDGSEFPVEISLSPLETSQGTLISSAIRDVSDRVRTQKELRDANEFLEQRVRARTQELAAANDGLVKSQESIALAQRVARIGTFEIDNETGRMSWTPGLEAIYGLSEGAFRGTIDAWLSMVHADDREDAKRALESDIQTHSPYSNEFRIVRPDGQVRWIRAQGQIFYGQQGEFRRLVGANLDITDRKNKENEIVALNTSLERRVEERTRDLTFANKELESFSYSVSHDLRAPLRHVDGFARIISEEYAGALPEEARGYLTRILKSTTDMGKLIDSLIKLAHLGRRELSCEKVNLGDLVKSTIAGLPQAEPSRNVEWRIETLPAVQCDPDLLRVVLTNLLSNALKFTRTRSAAVIEVGTTAKDGELAYFVKDNGVGFDPRYADKLFGVFQRLHAQEKFEGTGIGLATVHRIIHRHGGKIWAESAPEQGATFFFTIGVGRGSPPGADSANGSLRNQEPELAPAADR